MEYASIKRCGITRKVYFRPVPAAIFVCPAAVLVALAVYFCLHPVLGTGEIGWVCILAAFPFALGGFFTYNGMTLERFLLAYIRSEFLFPRRLVFKSDNIYAKALENSTIKEAL